jgi:hypothetical protein
MTVILLPLGSITAALGNLVTWKKSLAKWTSANLFKIAHSKKAPADTVVKGPAAICGPFLDSVNIRKPQPPCAGWFQIRESPV